MESKNSIVKNAMDAADARNDAYAGYPQLKKYKQEVKSQLWAASHTCENALLYIRKMADICKNDSNKADEKALIDKCMSICSATLNAVLQRISEQNKNVMQ